MTNYYQYAVPARHGYLRDHPTEPGGDWTDFRVSYLSADGVTWQENKRNADADGTFWIQRGQTISVEDVRSQTVLEGLVDDDGVTMFTLLGSRPSGGEDVTHEDVVASERTLRLAER